MIEILRRRAFLGGTSILIGALLSGCAGDDEFREGQRLMAAGDYDRAVVELRAAVERNREDVRFQIQLAEAEAVAGDAHFAAAEALLAQNRSGEARAELNTALDRMPAHPKAISLLTKVEADIARSEELTDEARAKAASKNYQQAYILVDQAIQFDASNPDAQRLRAEIVAAAPDAPALAGVTRVNRAAAPAAGAPAASGTPRIASTVQPAPPPARPASRPAAKSPPIAARRAATSAPAPALARASGRTASASKPPAERPAPAPPVIVEQTPPDAVPMPTTFRGAVSRDDKRLAKQIQTLDGILIKLKDTSKDPLNADMEISVGKYSKRYKKLRVGSRVTGRGVSQQAWQIVVLGIDDATETVQFSVELLPESRQQ